MLVVDSGGHIWKKGINCFFDIHYENNSLIIPSLDMHWSSLLPSDIFLGIGSTLVTVSVLEFICAQSPHSMKGLLFGVFFCIRGIFQSISSIALFSFTSRVIWVITIHHLLAVFLATSFLLLLLQCLVLSFIRTSHEVPVQTIR